MFWYFKGLSLYNRGVTKLNDSMKPDMKDQSQAFREAAKTDFTEAVTNASKAITLLDAQSAADL